MLADSYQALRRHEIARVSELLQSQLLQPLNLTPVQPQLGEADLFVLEGAGPADVGFNEFNPLFTREGVAIQASAVLGTQATFGDELTASGLHDQWSYSIGQYRFQTDGFRDNNDVKHELYTLPCHLDNALRSKHQFKSRHPGRGAARVVRYASGAAKSVRLLWGGTVLPRLGVTR